MHAKLSEFTVLFLPSLAYFIFAWELSNYMVHIQVMITKDKIKVLFINKPNITLK
jgi:hypothetical protein